MLYCMACALILYSHNSHLDELLEQNGSLDQVLTETQLRHHPVLNLVEATHKPLKVSRRGSRELFPSENVVDQLHL